jgi:hypothetical protein
MQIKRAALAFAVVIGGSLSGCTTNIYQVTKTENVFILPSGMGDPGNQSDEDELPDGANSSMSVLTRGGTNYMIVPRAPEVSANARRL